MMMNFFGKSSEEGASSLESQNDLKHLFGNFMSKITGKVRQDDHDDFDDEEEPIIY
jgi:hypothetical protein